MTDHKEKKQAPSKPQATSLLWIISIAAVLLSGLSFYYTQRSHTLASKVRRQATARLQAQIQTLALIQKKSLSANQKQQQTLHQLIKQNDIEKNSWQLLRAQHLLEVAQTTLTWEKDIAPAIFLLEKSDKLLAAPLNVDTTPLRKQIHESIISLKALPKIDTIGLLSKIDGVSQGLSKCRLKSEHIKLTAKADDKKEQALEKSTWRKTLNNSLNKLSNLVVIRYRKDKQAPMISLHEKDLLVKRIQLSLGEAKWAVVRQNKALYHYSLKNALINIEDAFDDTDAATQSIINAINELKKEPITPGAISIEPILKSLTQLIEGESA